ncbi:aldo-keto reductase family 1 member B1-like [Anastrepha obliqua]|uniref:aldo-keto reductase family 1 member B1-like n=1 Tax=Anastrepha obliqua TaxID=95512 RepID=UPI00240A5A34|nr:aldo-keto reductase family 1 member B1-like [Anastrepha obliqua]
MFVMIKKLQKTYFGIPLSHFLTFCKEIDKKRAPSKRFITNQADLLFSSGKIERELLKMIVPTTKLNNGVEMPIVGFGTWRMPADRVVCLVQDAIDVGYRHIDCADSYGNQKDVGCAIQEKIKEGVVERKDLFITGKLWNTKHDPNLVRSACENALNMLKITYFDNYLIHWPTGFADSEENYPKDKDGKTIFSDIDYVDTWCAMEALVECGHCRSIGLSNFNIEQIKRVLEVARIKPANLQIECHPYLNQSKLIAFCAENNILVSAYSPLGSPHSPYAKPGAHKLLQHPLIVKLSEKYQKGPALVLLRYQIQRGNAVITMSTRREHMADNLKVCDFELSETEITEINCLDFNGRYNLMENAKGHPHHPFKDEQN